MSLVTPGRTTRNSTYGRSSLSPPSKSRRTSIKSLSESAPAYGSQAEGNTTRIVNNPAEDIWFACRDSDGLPTSVSLSETGKGIHVRWEYPNYDNDGDAEAEEEIAEVEMMVDEAHDIVTPPPTASGPWDAHSPLTFSETQIAHDRCELGSVVLTPVKNLKPLQPSPAFIGDITGVQDGVLQAEEGYQGFAKRGPTSLIQQMRCQEA
ncbi:hypothetical protein JVU11DRAFT_7081 [Chiua virens]|nr:hypothetical protein JVU11DRAFT_7081 [Chiua virens]